MIDQYEKDQEEEEEGNGEEEPNHGHEGDEGSYIEPEEGNGRLLNDEDDDDWQSIHYPNSKP